jgi:hypothetical protein
MLPRVSQIFLTGGFPYPAYPLVFGGKQDRNVVLEEVISTVRDDPKLSTEEKNKIIVQILGSAGKLR